MRSKPKKKITLFVPADLLSFAQEATDEGISATVIKGLQLLAASRSYQELRGMRGKVKMSIDLKELRGDRKW